MTTTGTVRSWFSAEGWGVVDSPETPGGCSVFFSHVKVLGPGKLTPGQVVNLEWEPADQDGYRFRALRVWPKGTDPIETPAAGPSAAYSSVLEVTFDDADRNHRTPFA